MHALRHTLTDRNFTSDDFSFSSAPLTSASASNLSAGGPTGINIMQNPSQAQRGLKDGHEICVHTWSHKYMTSLTNTQVFAELYYTKKLSEWPASLFFGTLRN